MRQRAKFSIAIALLVSSACGTSHHFIQTAAPPHQLLTRSPSHVTVFTSDMPKPPHVEIGIVESQYGADDAAAIIDKMRAYAGTHGCDALVIIASHDATEASGSTSKTVSGKKRAACLVYTQPTAASKRDIAPACVANTNRACEGEYGCLGLQRCVESGSGYTLCKCQEQVAIPPYVGSP